MEINPGTVDLSDLREYQGMGINRLSVGIQSFSESHLRFLGRIHTVEDSKNTIHAARKANFSNISLDLIFGLPDQTKKSWIKDLQQALSFSPEHLSCYILTYEPDTPLYQKRENRLFTPLDDEKTGELFSTTQKFLSQQGYVQYEIANYARSIGLFSRHNRKYWRFYPYIGIGPSAHSYSDHVRSWNHRSVAKYIENLGQHKLPVENSELLNKEQQIIEFIYLGLRQTEGLSMNEFYQRFGKQFDTVFSSTIQNLQNRKLIQTKEDRCFLTPSGMLFLDSIAGMFVNHDLS